MLNGVYNNDNISNNYISRENNIAQVSDAQKKYATSPFKNSHFVDEMQISNEALNLYQKEQDICLCFLIFCKSLPILIFYDSSFC